MLNQEIEMNGSHSANLNLNFLKPGTYFIKVTTPENEEMSSIFIKK
jgi:hypothetical protein